MAKALLTRAERLFRRGRSFVFGPAGEEGAAAVEFAFAVPTVLAALYGIIEFGRVLFVQGFLIFAAEEASRFATVNYDATVEEIEAEAVDRLMLIGPGNIAAFNVQSTLNPIDQTKLVSVEIKYDYTPFFPMPWKGMTLSGSSSGFIVDE